MKFIMRQEEKSAKDDNQAKYRELFGIVDKYLIEQESSDEGNKKSGFIVYIDYDNDVDWVDLRDDSNMTDDQKKERNEWLAKLNVLQTKPHGNVGVEDALTYMKMLGAAYVLVMRGSFDKIGDVAKAAEAFIDQRNKEVSRKIYLLWSGVFSLIVLLLMSANTTLLSYKVEWINGISMGVLGAYVSVWQRYGKETMTGLSSKALHVTESLSRLFIGAIFSIVAMFAIRCGLILSNSSPDIMRFVFGLTGFAAGFSERFVPSMIERFISNTDKNE